MREWSVISANCLCRAILNNERSVAHHAFLHVTAGGVDVVIELSRAVLSVRLSEVTMKRGLASPIQRSSDQRPIGFVLSKSRLADDFRFPYSLVTLSRSLKVGTTTEATGKSTLCSGGNRLKASFMLTALSPALPRTSSAAISFPALAGSRPMEWPTRSLRRRLASVPGPYQSFKRSTTLEWLRHCSICRHDRLLTRCARSSGGISLLLPCTQRTGDGEVERKLCRKPSASLLSRGQQR